MRAFYAAPLALAGLAACASAPRASTESLADQARAIQSRVISIDTHIDIEPSMGTPENNPCLPTSHKVDLPKMRQGGLDVAFFAVYVGQQARNEATYAKAKADALAKFEAIHRTAEKTCPDQIEIAYTPDDVERIVKSGKLVAAIGIENGFVIGKDLTLIDRYQKLGARYMTLAHNGNNDIAGSAQPKEGLGDPPAVTGLTPFGEQVVAEMNRVGMMVDVSHVSKQTALDAMRVSKAPVIASHSSVVGINRHPRNFDDETLDALKKNGGVIQIVALGDFVKTTPPERAAEINELRTEFGLVQPGGAGRGAGGAAGAGAAGAGAAGGRAGGRGGAQAAALAALTPEKRAEYDKRLAAIEAKYPPANIEDFLNHIDYAVKRIGVDYVGISSDMDGGGGIQGWNDASETLNVTMGLLRRGYSEEDIRKMWGGNTLRVWRDVQRIAKELQSRSAS
jgi:membrane dipeptidase